MTPHPDSTDLEKAIRARKAARATALDPGTKLLAGAKLFDQVRARALCGIRTRHPEWTEAEVEAEFRRHLAARRARAAREIQHSAAQFRADRDTSTRPDMAR
ncbi:MAG: hypothetical protein KGQ61_05995 [Planctomycetes bacterium]|nr:hypothetical protein [Planctomycetota bacterium]